MFGFKKKEIVKEQIKVCQVDKNLSECSSVLNLRNYQQKLKEIELSNLRDLISKYFNIINDGYLISEIYSVEATLNNLIYRNFSNTYSTYEERFKAFGKEIDDYIQKEKIIIDLTNKIKSEKEKLGIQ